MTANDDNGRQLWALRVELAHVREQAASHYKTIAVVALVGMVFFWAAVTQALDGDAESALQTLCATVGFFILLLLWTAHRHHEQRRRDLAAVMAQCREAGHSVYEGRSGIFVT